MIGLCSFADLSLVAGKMRMDQIFPGGFRCEFSESQAASCKHAVPKPKSLVHGPQSGVLAGFLKLVISKEQVKTLSDFSAHVHKVVQIV
jgi:hypothetical protein